MEVNGKLQINWKLIHKVIKYIKDKILDIIYVQRTASLVKSTLNLFEYEQKFDKFHDSQYGKRKNLLDVWDDVFTGVRYVKLEQF